MKLASRILAIFGQVAAGRNSSKDVRATTLPLTIPDWSMSTGLRVSLHTHPCPNVGERQRSALQNVLKAPLSCHPMLHSMKWSHVKSNQTRHALQNLSSELTRWSRWVLALPSPESSIALICTPKNYKVIPFATCGQSTARDLQATIGGSQSHPRARAAKRLTSRASGRVFEPLPNNAWFTARARMAVQWAFFQALLLLQLLQHVMLVANCSEHANKVLNY